MNLRFWVKYNQSPVKLTLKPGQHINTVEGGPCEEGWAYEFNTYSHEFDHVSRQYMSKSRDCDGPLEYYCDDICGIDSLIPNRPTDLLPHRYMDEYDNTHYPEWEPVDEYYVDHYAQAMGY